MADFGDGSPRENYGSLDEGAPSVGNGQISQAQWEEYQRKRQRDAILGVLATLGATTGLGAIGGAAGGGAAASASPGALPPIAGGAPWAVTPYAGTAASAGTGAAAVGGTVGAGAAGAAGSVGAGAGPAAAGVGAGMSAKDWIALAAGLGGTIGGALQKPPDMSPNTGTNDPQLRELLTMMMSRLKKSEPLHDSVLSMANGLLPTQYQRPNPLVGGS